MAGATQLEPYNHDYGGGEIQNFRIQSLTADPGSPDERLLYWNSVSKVFRYWDGSAWQTVGTATGIDTEAVQDIVGAMFTAGNNIDVTYNDVAGTVTIDVEALTSADLSDFAEAVDDRVAALVVGGSAVTATYNDAANTLTLDVAVDNSSIEVNADAIRVKASGITNAMLAGSIALTKIASISTGTILGNNTGSAASPVALTAAQVKTMLAIVAADISNFDTQVRTSRLDQMSAPTAAVSMNSQKLTNLADGTASTDAVNLGQLNALVTGLKWKDPVAVVATTNITLSGLTAIDGYTPVAGDRVLAAGQSSAAANGIYVAAAGAWTRATDADSAAELNGATVLVLNGTNGKGDVYSQTATVVTVGTTAQVWAKVGEGNTVYTADGTTITLTGTSFSITAGGVGTTQLANNAVTAAKIATAAVDSTDMVGGGGTAINASKSTIPRMVNVTTVGATVSGGQAVETLTHNLGTRDIASVTVKNNASPYDKVSFPWEADTTNTVKIYSVANIPAGYQVTIIGRRA